MDADLRELKRAAETGGPWALYRFRVACLRAGRPELAEPHLPGDLVRVNEVESPWSHSEWVGVVIQALREGDGNVRPMDPASISWRVRPGPEYIKGGLYLTREDKRTLIEPVRPGTTAEMQ